MSADSTAAEFYGTAQGAVALRLVRERLSLLWPDLSGQVVLGLGHTAPYLRCWRATAARCIAAAPVPGVPSAWPGGRHSLACAVESDSLPLADLSVDRIVMVHGLENSDNAARTLREAWRVLSDHGRLLVVVPNRVGLWAHLDSTPFGQGQPYSAGQIERLLARCLFRVERRDRALYMPPVRHRLVLRSAALAERAGRFLAPTLAGLTITEASKEAYAAIPIGGPARRRFVFADAV